MSGPVVAEFVGGPQDGRIMALPDLPRTFRFPVCPGITDYLTSSPAPVDASPTYDVLVYEVLLDPAMGRPSRNDAGYYRYGYRGQR